MKTTSIQQIVTLHASPEAVYDALMDETKHGDFTGSEATISTEVGGEFSVFDGYAHGKNLELIPNQRIVQTWRAEEETWPADHDSIVQFELEPEGENTRLTFTQTNLPEPVAEQVAKGWYDFYWDPMNDWFAEK